MTRIDSALRYEANFIAKRATEKVGGTNGGMDRFRAYQPYITHEDWEGKTTSYHCCPRCWINDALENALHSIPSDSEDDILRCGVCGTDFVVPG